MEIFKLFGSILVDNDEANKSISKTDEKAEGLGKKFGNGIKTAAKWGAAIVVAAGTAAVAVGTMAAPLVKSAANAQAMQAQFEQVFSDLKDEAQSTMDAIAKSTGMLPNRLKPSFTQMAAFAKTTGMETADALALTERATIAAADSAAFYDRSIEDVTENLQSFLKGNYENDAALGISATETTRNAKANELYGKSFKDLDEAQKQLTLLAMVEDGNKLAGALGQAARESDAFENQIGNLKQAWEDLKVKFGEPILEPAVKGIQWLADALSNVNVEPIINRIEKVVTFIGSNIGPAIDVAKGKFGEIKQTVLDAIGFLEPYIIPIFTTVVDFIRDSVNKIVTYWQTDGQQLIEAAQNAFNMIWSIVQFFMPAILFLIQSVWGNIKGVISGALDIIIGVLRIFTGLFTGDWSKMWEGIKQLLGGALNFLWNLFSLLMIGKLLGGIKAFISSGIGFFKNFGSSVVGTFRGFIDEVITWFNYFRATGSSIWQALVDTIRNMITIFRNNVKSNFDDIWQTAVSVFNKIKDAILNPISSAKNGVKGFIDEIKGFFRGLKLELPKIKMPKFTIKNWSKNPADWLKAMPTLGIEWNALGGIASGPTVINTSRGLQGFGEVPGESEAFLPLNDKVLGAIGRGIAQTMSNESSSKGDTNINIYPQKAIIDEAEIARTFQRLEVLYG